MTKTYFRRLLQLILFAVILIVGSTAESFAQCSASQETAISLFMPDGQLIQHPIKVYLNRDIAAANEPRLSFAEAEAAGRSFAPAQTIPNQSWEGVSVDGATIEQCGTILIFDLHEGGLLEFWNPVRRFQAILSWTEEEVRLQAINRGPVNIGNRTAAAILTLVLVIVLLLSLWRWSTKIENRYCLLCAEDGHLSLSKVQVALWTIATGGLILYYGIIRREIPNIPEQVVILMGLSVITGGISYLAPAAKSSTQTAVEGSSDQAMKAAADAATAAKAAAGAAAAVRSEAETRAANAGVVLGASGQASGTENRSKTAVEEALASSAAASARNAEAASISSMKADESASAAASSAAKAHADAAEKAAASAKDPTAKPPRTKPSLADLLHNFPNDGDPEPSIARTQMVLWTVIVITLFVSKSILEGTLWAIPWEVVALTGISQASYLAPKFAPGAAL